VLRGRTPGVPADVQIVYAHLKAMEIDGGTAADNTTFHVRRRQHAAIPL